MTGIDPTDPATSAQGGHAFTDYTQFLDADALDGARIGVWREGTYDPDVSPEVDVIMEATIEALESQGATIVDGTRIPIEAAYEPEFAALLVPAGFVGPLPVGVSFIGGRWDEPALISLAYDFEQATDVRVPPTFLASTSADAAKGNAADREDRTVAPGRHGRWAMPSLR